MHPEIRTVPVEYTIFGHSLRHDPAKSFGEEILALLGRVWPIIKTNAIPNDGINRVVYDKEGGTAGNAGGCIVFAGVVLGNAVGAVADSKAGARAGDATGAAAGEAKGIANRATAGVGAEVAPWGFERKTVRLTRYAYWKHVGPYRLIPATGAAMTKALEARGERTGWPMVEVYGHWSNDESKLKTETFVALR